MDYKLKCKSKHISSRRNKEKLFITLVNNFLDTAKPPLFKFKMYLFMFSQITIFCPWTTLLRVWEDPRQTRLEQFEFTYLIKVKCIKNFQNSNIPVKMGRRFQHSKKTYR